MGTLRSGAWLAGVLLFPAQALGQSDATRAAARDLGAEGVEDFQAGNYAAASDKLGRAFNILRVPSLGLWSARALAKSGKLVEASERYLNVTRLDASKGDAAVQKQAQADAVAERDALQPRIPGLTLDVKGNAGDAVVSLDGAPVEPALFGVRLPANPGKHVAEARQAALLVRREVTLSEGQRLNLTLDFSTATAAPAGPPATASAAPAQPAAAAAPAPATPGPQPLGPAAPPADSGAASVPAGVWVGVGIAGVGVAVGGITAVLASKKKSDLNCAGDHCLPSQQSDVDGYNRLLTMSTIGFISAGAGVALAGVFWFTRPRETERAAYMTPWVGLGAAGVKGAF